MINQHVMKTWGEGGEEITPRRPVFNFRLWTEIRLTLRLLYFREESYFGGFGEKTISCPSKDSNSDSSIAQFIA